MTWAVRLPEPDACRVLVVGTAAHVPPSRLPPLPQAAASAEAFAAALTGEDGLFDARHVRLVRDPVTQRDVLDPLRDLTGDPQARLLLFYFAGHGLLGRDDRLCLALKASTEAQGGGDPAQSLPFAEVAHLMDESPAAHKVAVLDCCFSGRALNTPGGIHLLTACGPTEKALFDPTSQLTGFTGELLRLLDEGIPDGPAYLDLATVHRRLSVVLPTTPAPPTGLLPGFLPAPHQRSVDDSADLALAPNRAFGTACGSAGLRSRARFAQRLKRLTEPSPTVPVPDPVRSAQLARLLAALAEDAMEALGPADEFSVQVRLNHAAATGIAGRPARAVLLLAGLLDDLKGLPDSDAALARIRTAHAYWSRES